MYGTHDTDNDDVQGGDGGTCDVKDFFHHHVVMMELKVIYKCDVDNSDVEWHVISHFFNN